MMATGSGAECFVPFPNYSHSHVPSPVESPSPMNGIYFVGVLLNRKP